MKAHAGEHAARLARDGELPPGMIIGRWWRDEIAEVDVLGMIGDQGALLGECRWQASPLTNRDLIDLQRKIAGRRCRIRADGVSR